MKNEISGGWDWFEGSNKPHEDQAVRWFQDCFSSPSGKAVLSHLRKHFLERRLAATASSDELRHLEGARCAIAYIERLALASSTIAED